MVDGFMDKEAFREPSVVEVLLMVHSLCNLLVFFLSCGRIINLHNLDSLTSMVDVLLSMSTVQGEDYPHLLPLLLQDCVIIKINVAQLIS